MRISALLEFFLALVLLTLPGCKQAQQGGCTLDSECGQGMKCLFHSCVPTSGEPDGGVDGGNGGDTATDGAEIVLSGSWGAALGSFGMQENEEGSSTGPMSFTLAPDGKLYVLDQINNRVQEFDGPTPLRAIPIPGEALFEDLAVDADGQIALLDYQKTKAVTLLSAEGEVRATIPLLGPGLVSTQEITGLFMFGEAGTSGIWVESAMTELVRVAGLDGTPDPEQPSLFGRPVWFGDPGSQVLYLLKVESLGDITAVVSARPRMNGDGNQIKTTITFKNRVQGFLDLSHDDQANIYLVANLLEEPDLNLDEVVVLDKDLTSVLARKAISAGSSALDTFQTVRVSQDGHFYQMALDEAGLVIRKVKP
jgi:hypothetical protein